MNSRELKKRLFEAALAVSKEKRESYIRQQPISDEMKAQLIKELSFYVTDDQAEFDTDISRMRDIRFATDNIFPTLPNLERYKVGNLIGQGGMGRVYVGYQKSPRRKVAIKVLHPSIAQNQSSHKRFIREAHVMGQFDHPNIVKVIDFVEQDGCYCLVMEYVEGTTLEKLVASSGGHLSEQNAKTLMIKLANALSYAHSKGVIHRDIKLSNVLIDRRKGVRLTDLEIAATTQHARWDDYR